MCQLGIVRVCTYTTGQKRGVSDEFSGLCSLVSDHFQPSPRAAASSKQGRATITKCDAHSHRQQQPRERVAQATDRAI